MFLWSRDCTRLRRDEKSRDFWVSVSSRLCAKVSRLSRLFETFRDPKKSKFVEIYKILCKNCAFLKAFFTFDGLFKDHFYLNWKRVALFTVKKSCLRSLFLFEFFWWTEFNVRGRHMKSLNYNPHGEPVQ